MFKHFDRYYAVIFFICDESVCVCCYTFQAGRQSKTNHKAFNKHDKLKTNVLRFLQVTWS